MNIYRVPAAYAAEIDAAIRRAVKDIEHDQALRAAGADEHQLMRESRVAVFMVDPDEPGDCVVLVALPNDVESTAALRAVA